MSDLPFFRIKTFKSLTVFFALTTLSLSGQTVCAQFEPELLEARNLILSQFQKKVSENHLYTNRNNCVSFDIEDMSEGVAEIVVHVSYGYSCSDGESADSSQSPPVLDRFIANPVGEDFEFFWLNANGDPEPFENAGKNRK